MAEAIAGEVLGPRPGKAACSFTQGIVEIVLRICTAVVSVLVVIAGALVIGFNVTSDDSGDPQATSNSTGGLGGELAVNAAGAICIVAGILGLVWEVIMVILRILNIGLLNLKPKIFLSVDIVVQIIIAIIFIVAGLIAAVFASGNEPSILGSLIVAVIFSFAAAILLATLVTWMVFYIINEWTDKIVKYTLKEAITG